MANSRKSLAIDALGAIDAALVACLTRHVTPGRRLAVGLSGGIDSVVLLHALARRGWHRLSALHVHHGLSPNADRWAAFCEELCTGLALPCECVRVTVEHGTRDGPEAAARRARHAAFAAASADWILLAHHRDDQAETLLFNLLRGTGLAGAAAMRERSGRLLRPFLGIGRAAIEAYAVAHRLDWIEDESNADLRHSRNFLRRRILPEIGGRFPAAARNLAAAAARFAEANELLDMLARADIGETDEFPVSVASLAKLDAVRARNALRYLLARREVQIPSEARLRETLRQLLDAAPDRHPTVQFGMHRLCRRRGWIHLEPVEKSAPA